MIQDFLSHGISIPIESCNKFMKKLVKIRGQDESCVNYLCGVNGTIGIAVTNISSAPCGVGLD